MKTPHLNRRQSKLIWRNHRAAIWSSRVSKRLPAQLPKDQNPESAPREFPRTWRTPSRVTAKQHDQLKKCPRRGASTISIIHGLASCYKRWFRLARADGFKRIGITIDMVARPAQCSHRSFPPEEALMRFSRRITILSLTSLSLILSTIASAQWQKKPYSQWSEKEALNILNNSPWGQTQTYTDTSHMFDEGRRVASNEKREIEVPEVRFRIRLFSSKPIR